MPSGLEIRRADGSLQLDAEVRVPCFLGKGSVTTTAITGYPSNSLAKIPVGTNEFISVGSSAYCFFGAKRDGYQEIFVGAAAGATVDWYKWGYAPPTATFGFQVWNASGQLVFDATQKPLNVAAIAGLGTTSLTAGRTYSFLASQVRVVNDRFAQYTGAQPDVQAYYVSSTNAHSIRRNGSNAEVADQTVSVAVSGPYDPDSPPVNAASWTSTQDNGLTTAYVIIDVTHY